MKSAVLCLLLTATALQAFTIPRGEPSPDQPSKAATVQPEDHKIDKRFVGMLLMNSLLDDDDYFDDEFTLNGRRRPSRRTIQLAQLIRELAGRQGLTRAQMQNITQNLQNLQMLQNLQQLQGLQNLPLAQRQSQTG